MKYSWFINLTTEKQTMATRGVWHPLLPNSEVATWLRLTLGTPKSPIGVRCSVSPPPRWHSGEWRLFPLIIVFYQDKVEREASPGLFHLAKSGFCLSFVWHRVNEMSTAASSLRRKRGKWKRGREPSRVKSHQRFQVVLIGEEEEEKKEKRSRGMVEGEQREDERPLPLRPSRLREDSLKWGEKFCWWHRCENENAAPLSWRCHHWLLMEGGRKKKHYTHNFLDSRFLSSRLSRRSPLSLSLSLTFQPVETHRRVFCISSWLSHTHSLISLPLMARPLSPSLPLSFKSPRWPWAAAASEVAKVQSQYAPTKLVKY